MAKKRMIVYVEDREYKLISDLSFNLGWSISETARQGILYGIPELNKQAEIMVKRLEKKQ